MRRVYAPNVVRSRANFLGLSVALSLTAVGLPRIARATGGADIDENGAASHTIRVLLSTASGERAQQIDPWRFTWSGRTYRGTFASLALLDGGPNALIATVPLDAYLYGVLSREISAAWAPGAQQAQAVVARTYALSRLKPQRPYDVRASDDDQNYGGIETESVEAKAAIDATAGIVLTYGGGPAHVAYSSCCGGRTAAAADVWGTAYPYLTSIADPNCADAPGFAWTADVSLATLASDLRGPVGELGAMREVDVRTDDPAARPRALAFVGVHSTVEVPLVALRAAVGPNVVRSAYVRRASLSRGAGTLALAGTGHGHGVGLCQWGARALGESGAGAAAILGFYFPGTGFGRA